jgi:CHAT domain-containing protein
VRRPISFKAAFFILLVCASLFSFMRLNLRAQSERGTQQQGPQADAGRRLAFIVGNQKYAEAPLQNSDNDANAMDSMLTEVGFQVRKVLDADRNTIISSFGQFAGEIHPGDSVLFYYAGHAIQIDGSNYLIPLGFTAKSSFEAKSEAINVGDLLEELNKAQPRVTIVILDSCRTNPYSGSRGFGGLHALETGQGTFIAFAAAPDRSASDDPSQQHGRFTGALLDALKVPGLSVDAVFNRVRKQVVDESNGSQIPWSNSALVGEFIFRPAPQTLDSTSVLSEVLKLKELNDQMDHAVAAGQIDSAILFGKQAVNQCQKMRADIRTLPAGAQGQFIHDFESTYRNLADVLASHHRAEESRTVIALLKDQENFDLLPSDATRLADQSSGSVISLTRSESQIETSEANMAKASDELNSLKAKKELTPDEKKRMASLQAQINIENGNLEEALDAIMKPSGSAPGGSMEALNGSAEIQALLRRQPSGAVSIYTLVTENKLITILVTATAAVAHEVPISTANLNRLVFSLVSALKNPSSDPRPPSLALYNVVVAPLAADLRAANAKTILWSLDGTLRYISPAALFDGHSFLAEQYSMVSLSAAPIVKLDQPRQEKGRTIVFGESKAIGGFSPEPGVLEEAKAIQMITNGTVLLDKDFTRQSFESALHEKQFSIVHLATHFVLASERDRSYLLFGNGDRLSLGEIQQAPRMFDGVDLLVFSGCETAIPSVGSDGKEVDGLNVIAVHAGARSVIASLWAASDQGTAIFMRHFYEHLWNGATKAEALRLAQMDMFSEKKQDDRGVIASRSDYSHPYYWAPFVLSGDWF